MEQLDLTTPVVNPETTKSNYRVVQLNLQWEHIVPPNSVGAIDIRLRDNLGGYFSHSYYGQQAIDFMKFMNTANFSVNSMHKRILQKLSADGILPGTVSGAPDA